VRLELAGKTFSAQLGARQEELELRVPTLGRLEVACSPSPAIPRKLLGVQLKSLDEAGVQQWVQLKDQDSVAFDAVLPGHYELGFATWQAGESDEDPGKLIPQKPTVTIQITAGVTTRIDLR